ncbi:hypothetical protein C9374_000244 [Naegleria lovaniensis]|uniref:Uncharacterized protein n=1 Tax=Naegleria lovaniensis TaxID=51637 RepID=A0AA88GTW4_NAELO|nr:uncharacterized protein C9374_000244 [Naegleria lovaniensis]KAG2388805.1 hypothetical protein C9374_000244 [Naegleria lovaniensis]
MARAGTFWKVFVLTAAVVVGGLIGMKHQYEMEEKWAKKFSARVRLELEKEIEEEGLIEKMLEMEKKNSMMKSNVDDSSKTK